MLRNFVEFFEYMNSNISSGSFMVGLFTCMLFDILFSATSCFLEKSFDLMSKRKEKKQNNTIDKDKDI